MKTNKIINFPVFLHKAKSRALVLILIFSGACLSSCSDFLEIAPPVVETDSDAIFKDDNSAESAVTGIYSEMININSPLGGGRSCISYLTSMSADELNSIATDEDKIQFNSNTLLPDNTAIFDIWQFSYRYIYYANSVLMGLSNSVDVTGRIKNQLEGESRFIRAFIYFHLVNLYGDIPLITSTDLETNRLVSRAPKEEIYDLILSDLTRANELLLDDYSFSSGEKTRVNRFVTQAFLARVYLYLEDWENAEIFSTMLIDNATFSLSALNEVFTANSAEAIWQFYPEGNQNAYEGQTFILNSEVTQALTLELVNDFEDGDNRFSNWVGTYDDGTNIYYYPYKYKISPASDFPLTEYSTIFRLAEMYLIRAEARAHQNNFAGSQSDLNVIRNRAGLIDTGANDQTSLLLAIEQERRVEFFTEGGHRWFDLKRTGHADAVLNPIKADWQSTDVLFPIPSSDITLNRNLIQNDGY